MAKGSCDLFAARLTRILLSITLLSVATFSVSCTDESPNMLEPAGEGARRIEGLWWLMLWIAAAVFVVVLALIAYAVIRSRTRTDPKAPARWGEPFVAIGGAGVPFLILTALFVVSLRDMDALSSPPEEPSLVIEVIGHDWWWEVTYPNGAVTANEIHVPVGSTVRLELETADVIHSFWVPQLQVKMDMIPGRTNRLWLKADAAGTYRGQCAEYCGLQHANMAFYVVADPPDEFEDWVANEAADARLPVTDSETTGSGVFFTSTCATCHAIRGGGAEGEGGPDLTHLATRETIAAGTIEQTRTNLRSWILDPQSIKPGAAMPPTDLSSDEVEALLDYLESLE